MITKENCKKLENGKVIMDFAVKPNWIRRLSYDNKGKL